MKWKTIGLIALMLTIATAPAWAQYRREPRGRSSGSSSQPDHRIEILGYGGYLWSGSIDAWYGNQSGELDLADGAIWGIEADVTVRPGSQLVLLYHRQDTELTFKYRGIDYAAGNLAVEYWQIGGMGGVQRGNIMTFGMFTVGGARLIPDVSGVQNDDVWKFSVLFGLGAKVYINDRIGLRVQGRMPWIILDGGAAVSVGSGGAYTSFGGSGIVQGDVSGGLFVMF